MSNVTEMENPELKRLRLYLPLCLLVITLALLLSSCSAGKKEGGSDKQLSGGAGKTSRETVFFVDGNPVTREDLNVFKKIFSRTMSSSHGRSGEDLEVLGLVQPYVNYYSVVQEARKKGYEKKPGLEFADDAVRLAISGPEFMKWFVDNAEFSKAEIKSMIPPRWVMMNFGLKVFDSQKAAQAARQAMKTPEDFTATSGNLKVSERKNPDTGLIFPGSGFFGAYDDKVLFDLHEGEISQPVESGIGWIICLVKERKDLSEEERSNYLRRKRANWSLKRAQNDLNRYVQEKGIQVKRENLKEAIQREYLGLGFSDLPVLSVAGEDLSYRTFRYLVKTNYKNIFDAISAKRWMGMIQSDLEVVGRKILAGQKGDEDIPESAREKLIPDSLEKVIRLSQGAILYSNYIQDYKRNVSVSVSKSDAIKYYDDNKNRFRTPASARIRYLLSPYEKDRAMFERIVDQGGGPDDILAAMRGNVDTLHGKNSIKIYSLRKGQEGFDSAQKAVFGSMSDGDVKVVAADTGGVMAIELLEKSDFGTYPFSDVQETIMAWLRDQKAAPLVMEHLKELVETHKVVMNKKFIPQKLPEGIPDLKSPETG